MSKKKKTYDQKIEEYTEKLKIAQREKKEFIEKKGRQLWTKLKTPFIEKEKAIEILLVDKDKLNILVEGIKKILDSFSFEVSEIEINTTNVNEIKEEKEEKNDTR
ncbi:hypothetical protein HMPREF3051_00360 [Fusobacterium sp. HMSC064B11]|jgi:hypothetical protein|uniref:Uncharacterized protein n=2 Tax=Fusobacterium TaxID=848 RepID=A0A2C6B2T8_FUSNP|nr:MULTISPECIES: hypothetical protein [Fusobacterium]ETZ26621.1 hypothetical protein HMPREF2085_01453 [Fusobacterium nucleatum 13_3C]OFO29466.1 hypothetical protein HMPREF3051_00360 [Fusobacterium sp. HMSC064B11]PHH99907.1 hypothetical protein CA836_09750 [Fusobacterium polymorphum]